MDFYLRNNNVFIDTPQFGSVLAPKGRRLCN